MVAHLPPGTWRDLDDIEFATLGYIDWLKHRRLYGEIADDNSYIASAEFEATYYRQSRASNRASGRNKHGLAPMIVEELFENIVELARSGIALVGHRAVPDEGARHSGPRVSAEPRRGEV